MEDFDSMPAFEMVARRRSAEVKFATALGKFLFSYSRFVSALHLCVAWSDNGNQIERHASATDLGAADLLHRIETRVQEVYKPGSKELKKYKKWLRRAHDHRTTRNTVMHSRWSTETFGRHLIAVSASPVSTPGTERIFTQADLDDLLEESSQLADELDRLRESHPL